MKKLVGACIVGQSGGPTSVINSSVLGVIEAAFDSDAITQVLAAKNGILGILNEDIVDLSYEERDELALLKTTPSSAFGSCRYKLSDYATDDTDYKRILEVFRKYNIRYFFYNGGNDSMDTCNKVSAFFQEVGYECRVIGIPKTIDNDLIGTDHCPGFASAAKFIANTCMEIRRDTQVYTTPTVNVIEIMGRHAGWLAGSSALASVNGEGPDLVYLPEVDFDMDSFLNDVRTVISDKGNCVVAVSEGIHYSDGSFINDVKTATADGFGHVQLGGLGVYLAEIIKNKLGFKARGIELSLLQRCAEHIASATDIEESYQSGKTGMEQAIAGKTGFMVAFDCTRKSNYYHCETTLVPLAEVANREKTVPIEWINEKKNGVTDDFITYALPLIQGIPEIRYENGLPRYAHLKLIKAQTKY